MAAKAANATQSSASTWLTAYAATTASVSPPAANSGTRLRRSGAPAARHWRTSIATATTQRPSVTADPKASAASRRPGSSETSSTLRGHSPRQPLMTSSASLTSSAGRGASGIST